MRSLLTLLLLCCLIATGASAAPVLLSISTDSPSPLPEPERSAVLGVVTGALMGALFDMGHIAFDQVSSGPAVADARNPRISEIAEIRGTGADVVVQVQLGGEASENGNQVVLRYISYQVIDARTGSYLFSGRADASALSVRDGSVAVAQAEQLAREVAAAMLAGWPEDRG